MQNRMSETPGAKLRENFEKSKRPTLAAGGGDDGTADGMH